MILFKSARQYEFNRYGGHSVKYGNGSEPLTNSCPIHAYSSLIYRHSIHLPSSPFICHHYPSFTLIHLHLPPLAFIFLNPPSSTPISLHLPSFSFIYLHYKPSFTFINLHLPPLTFIYLHLPSSTSISLH